MNLTAIKPHEPSDESLFMALPGKLVREIIKRFACKEDSGRPVLESLGVGERSLSATDTRRVIVIGKPEAKYQTTDRRCALLEAERSIIYKEGYDAGNVLPVEDQFDPANNPPSMNYPNVSAVIKKIDSMKFLGAFSPEFLRDAASIGVAAGAVSIELYIEETDDSKSILGFKVAYKPDQPAFGDADEVPMSGLIMSRLNLKKEKKAEDDEEDPAE